MDKNAGSRILMSHEQIGNAYAQAMAGDSYPDLIIANIRSLRFMLRQLGWNRNKIRRYEYKLNAVAAKARKQHKANPGIESPALFEAN